MIVHYNSCSGTVPGTKDFSKHEFPEYGLSTTDPTFYEPTATRIANMKKSASALKGIYDYNGKLEGKTQDEIRENALNQLRTAEVDIRFSNHGMTREEISQVTMEKSLEADKMISDKKKQYKDNTDQLKKELEIAEAISKSLDSDRSDSSENTIQNGE